MKKTFFLIASLFVLAFAGFAGFALYQWKDYNEFHSTHDNMFLFRDQIDDIITNIDKSIDTIIEQANIMRSEASKQTIFPPQQTITNLINSLNYNLETYGCIRCHTEKDSRLNKIRETLSHIDEKSTLMQTSIIEYISARGTFTSLLRAKSELRFHLEQLRMSFHAMETNYMKSMYKKSVMYPKIELLMSLIVMTVLIVLITIFYKKIIKDIYRLTEAAEHADQEDAVTGLNLDDFKSDELRSLAEAFQSSIEKLRKKEMEQSSQIEEIKAMNDELQTSNNQMEMVTTELEEIRENLEHKVREKTKELERAYNDLQELDTLKSNFLHSISHEFKTPLTPLFGYLKLFKNRELGELTPLQEQSIDIMLTCSEKLYNTIEDLILLARLDVEKEKYPLRDVDLTYLLKNVSGRLEKEIAEKKIKFSTELPEISIIIKGEQLMLIQTVLHLLRNAIKYSPEGGEIRCILNQEDTNAVIRITDNGSGMTAQAAGDVNDYLSSNTVYSTKKSNVITVGLNLLKRVIVFHNAKVQYKSQKNRGTDVKLMFPLKA